MTVDGVIRGTLPYMPPELLEGREADVRSDVFAFGAVLYEMLTGRRAFVGDTESAVVRAILDSQPVLDTTNALIPPPLAHLVTTCLAKDPDERWQSAGDLRRQLAWIAESGRAPAHGAGTDNADRKRFWLWRTAAVVFLLTSVAMFYMILSRDEPPASGRVRFQIPPPANTTFTDLAFRLSPNGRNLAYMAAGPDGVGRLWVHSIETGEARMLVAAGALTLGPGLVWSPDGKFLAFSADRKIKKIAVDGGSPQTLVDAAGGANDWSAEDVFLFVANGVVKRVPGSGGTATPLTALDATRQEISHYLPRLLPDGRHFLYLRRSLAEENSGIFVGSIDARPEEQDMTRLVANAGMAVYAPAAEDPELVTCFSIAAVHCWPRDSIPTRCS